MPLIAAKRDLTKRSPRCSRFPVGSVARRCLTTARPRVSPAFAMLRRGRQRRGYQLAFAYLTGRIDSSE